jgi:hypothetical protein
MRGAAAAASRRMALKHGIVGGGSNPSSPRKNFYKAVMGNKKPRSRSSSPTKDMDHEVKLITSAGVESSLAAMSSSLVVHSKNTSQQSRPSSADEDTSPRSGTIVKKRNQREPLQLPYKEHIPVHMFNIVFWPHTEPLEAVDTTTDVHNSSMNAFDLILNKREALFCQLCDKKLRVVNCRTCSKGYCFDCAFRLVGLAFSIKQG